jgi:hypothetical protein
MANILKMGLSLLAATAAAGCTTEDYTRADGLTSSAGNTMYANTVMQMVDPWQPRVQHTKLRVPADRNSQANAASADAPSQPAAPSTTE